VRIALLAGGDSPEREVSLMSGKAVEAVLLRLGHAVTVIDPGSDLPAALLKAAPEFVWIALHGDKGENGVLQGLLDWMGLPYNGSGVLTSAMAMDKVISKRLFLADGIPTPGYRVATAAPNLELSRQWAEQLGLPLVVKPADGGSTVGVTIAQNVDQLSGAIALSLKYCQQVLIEQYIPGQEITVTMLNDQLLPAIEIVPQGSGFYDYEAKYAPGGSRHLIPPNIEASILKNAVDMAYRACKSLQCTGLVRADVLIDANGKPWVLEVNTLPGMTATSLAPEAAQATGISFEQLIMQLLEKR
jgi:D-alanine-D-alanine ligase